MSRALLRSIRELRPPTVHPLPPSFLLPLRARAFNTTHANIDPAPEEDQHTPGSQAASPDSRAHSAPVVKAPPQPPTPDQLLKTPLSDSVRQLLPLLKAQPAHYITAHIHGRPYLVTAGDELRLPFRMPGVQPGDVLRLNRAAVIASRDLTLKGAPYVDERLFECRATVLAHESMPLQIKIKRKRRNRKRKQAKSKQRYTVLRISELKINDVEGLED